MGFLAGSATFERYWVTEDPTDAFGPEHLKILEKFKIGASDADASGEPRVGFLAGSHLLDTRFDLEKNIIGDAMHFGVRIDTDQIPAAVRNAWLQMELLPLTIDNPSGRPTKAQRQEAKEAVEARCEEEVKTGRFRRMQQVPVLWDAANDVIYLGSSSASANEMCLDLLGRSFELELDRITSGKLAKVYADEYKQHEGLFQLAPASFTADAESSNVCWWNGMGENYDYLGNEFLLWLWWQFEQESASIKLSDDSTVVGMFARTLSLDCPAGESGKETISAECPIGLPEAGLAIRSGKLPRKAGLTLVRDGQQYDFSLQAETFAVSGGKISHLGERAPSENSAIEDRLTNLRAMSDTLDLLFDAFLTRRIGKPWTGELKKMRRWLDSGEKRGKTAA